MIAGKRNRDAIVMDAPIWYHTPKLILWCVFEALDLFLAIWITREWSAGVKCLPFLLPVVLPPDLQGVANWLYGHPHWFFQSLCLLMQKILLFCSLNASYCETAQWCSYTYNVLLPVYGMSAWTVLSLELFLRCGSSTATQCAEESLIQ